MARKLPDVDSFAGMLRQGFPDGPLSDVKPATCGTTLVSLADLKRSAVVVEDPAVSPVDVVVSKPEVLDPVVKEPVVDQIQTVETAKEHSNNPLRQSIINTPAPIIESPVIEPAKIQTVSQTDIQTVIQTVDKPDGYSASPSDGLSTLQPTSQPVIQPVSQTVSQSDGQLFGRSDVPTVSQTVVQPFNQTVSQTVRQNYPAADTMMFADPVRGLTRSQCLVLLYLIQQPGITQRPAISEYTGVPFGTVKDALALLFKKGFISKPQYYVCGDYRGISYVINRSLCDDFLRKRGAEFNQTVGQPVNQTVIRTVSQTVVVPDGYSDGQTVPFSSKVFKEDLNLTTNSDVVGLLNDPELRFWKGEGVSEKQVQNWMAEFQMSQEEIILSMRYGRFDILERGDVQNSANWFYKILTRNGFYPKPANYRSLIEIKAAALKQQQEQDRAAMAQLVEAEFETKFQAFLLEQTAPLYEELLAQISGFAKEQIKEGDSQAAEIELKDLFKKHLARK